VAGPAVILFARLNGNFVSAGERLAPISRTDVQFFFSPGKDYVSQRFPLSKNFAF